MFNLYCPVFSWSSGLKYICLELVLRGGTGSELAKFNISLNFKKSVKGLCNYRYLMLSLENIDKSLYELGTYKEIDSLKRPSYQLYICYRMQSNS